MPKQRSGFLALGGTLVAATMLVGGTNSGAADQALAGTCVDRDAAPAACADPAAVYQVLTTVRGTHGSCPAGDYFTHDAGSRTLCLGFNVAAGDCVRDDPEGPQLVRCTTDPQTPTIRVLRVVEDRATPKACRPLQGGAVAALTYSVPAKTLCLVHQPLAAAAG